VLSLSSLNLPDSDVPKGVMGPLCRHEKPILSVDMSLPEIAIAEPTVLQNYVTRMSSELPDPYELSGESKMSLFVAMATSLLFHRCRSE
jgi:hypothetical protein